MKEPEHEPNDQASEYRIWTYLKDVLTLLPTHLNSRIGELLPHRWQPNA